MNFSEYQNKSRETAVYPNVGDNYIYPLLGLVGETGEVAEIISKVIRDDGGVLSDEKKMRIQKELGDVMWYLSQVATELDLSLDEIAFINITKLGSRTVRGRLHGDGDDR